MALSASANGRVNRVVVETGGAGSAKRRGSSLSELFGILAEQNDIHAPGKVILVGYSGDEQEIVDDDGNIDFGNASEVRRFDSVEEADAFLDEWRRIHIHSWNLIVTGDGDED